MVCGDGIGLMEMAYSNRSLHNQEASLQKPHFFTTPDRKSEASVDFRCNRWDAQLFVRNEIRHAIVMISKAIAICFNGSQDSPAIAACSWRFPTVIDLLVRR